MISLHMQTSLLVLYNLNLSITALQVYPTSMRSMGVGVASSVSRLGAILSPFVSVALVRSGFTPLAEALLATACLAGAAAALLLPIETQGRPLLVCRAF